MNDRSSGRRPSGGRPTRKPAGRTADSNSRPSRAGTAARPAGPGARSERPEREDRPRGERSGPDRPSRPAGRSEKPASSEERPRKESGPRTERTSSGRPRRPGQGGRPVRAERPVRKTADRDARSAGAPRTERPASKRAGKRPPKFVRDGGGSSRGEGERSGPARPERGFRERDASTKRYVGRGPDRASKRGKKAEEGVSDGTMRLNRYLSNAGVASRREADDLIKAGVVTVNGKIVTEMGTKVGPGDVIHYGGQKLSTEKKRYVLLNKPKDFITTTDDPRDRRTVMALIDDACTERLYPVGRLDRHTTGVLLMTNDGDLAKKLTHPSHGAEKIYHATLDKALTKADLERLVSGIHLEDGPANADEASYVANGTKKEVGLKIHMGRNRVVRRMFEAMGYEVVKLDRVVFAGLTKKDLPRGKWRHLTEKEVLFLSKRK